jgi:hypothetical protein
VKRFSKIAVAAVSVAGLSAALAVPGTAASAAPSDPVRTIATGFAGPLHVAGAERGQVYVADAFAGQIARVDRSTGSITTVVSDPAFTPGVDVRRGRIFFTSSIEPEAPGDAGAAVLKRSNQRGKVKQVADLLAFELANNPDGQPQNDQDALSNPYAVLALPGRTLVADAAGNDIVEVRGNGRMRALTVFPVSFAGDCATATNNGVENGGCDPVPTDLAMGKDGYLYVSGLGAEVEGFIWKVHPRTGEILRTWDGLPPLTGIATGRKGRIYAASLFTSTVFRFGRHGGVATAEVPGVTGLDFYRGRLYAGSLDFEGGPGSLLQVGPAAFHPAG